MRTITQREQISQLEGIFRRFQKTINAIWNKRGIHVSRTNVILLTKLQTDGPQKISSLADSLSITSGAVTGISDKLIASGLVERRRSEMDRRLVYLSITEKGLSILGELQERRQQLMNDLVQDVSDEDAEKLIQIFEQMLLNAEKLMNEE